MLDPDLHPHDLHATEEVEGRPAPLPRVPDAAIEQLSLADIGRLCGRLADLPTDRWTSLVVDPTSSIPPLPFPF
jgi:hypothetical protein